MKSAAIAEFDIAIVGAGIAGSALACALKDSGFRIALLESASFPQQAPVCETNISGFDARVSAITLGSKAFLEHLGVWGAIQNLRLEEFSDMQVWDAEGVGEIRFSATEIGGAQLGYIVENRVLTYALLEALSMSANIKMLDNTQVLDITSIDEDNNQRFRLQLNNEREIKATLLVGADGANSFVRQALRFKTREWDYQHNAIVCTVQTENHHQHAAWQRFMPTGPLALLPLSSKDVATHFCSIVWSVIPAEAERLMKLSDKEFMLELTNAFESRLGNILSTSRRFSFPLRQRHAKDYVQEGVALIADAAHTIHPLAGQGINLGLQDVLVLAEELQRAKRLHHNIGDLRVLSRYQRRRKADNLLMMTVMEGFKRLFEQRSLLVRWIRNQGMLSVGKHTVLKKQLIKQAMGLR
jgi:2-octaprenylphenol hydroxylase